MAVASAGSEAKDPHLSTKTTRFGSAVTGHLSDDFLRIADNKEIVPTGDIQALAAYDSSFSGAQYEGGILTVTLVQAKLAKNYGMTRMDPYCRMKVGMQVFETPTAYNGSKTPRWNKLIQCHINESLKEIYIEIFDECSFSVDERIGWGSIALPETVFTGNTMEGWYPLSGKQGEGKEGMIHVVLQYQKLDGDPKMQRPLMVSPFPGGMGVPMTVNHQQLYGYSSFVPPAMLTQQTNQANTQPEIQTSQSHDVHPTLSQSIPGDLKTLKEMCPEMDEDIILSVLQQSGGSLEKAAEQLLEMSAS